MRYVIRLHFTASNNVAEYEVLINGLRIATELGIRRLEIKGDSRLAVDQVMKESSCESPMMAAYCQVVRQLEENFDGLELVHIPRRLNLAADELAKMGSGRQPVPNNIFANDQHKPSIRLPEGEKPVARTSDRDVTTPPKAPVVPDPNSRPGQSKAQNQTPAIPEPPSPPSPKRARGLRDRSFHHPTPRSWN